MFKRKTALLFNLFAYTIVLALMVLPHHHHEDEVCVLNAACHSDHNEDDHDHDHNNDKNQNHSSCDKEHVCLLEKEIVFLATNLEHLLKASDSVDNLKSFDGPWISAIGSDFKTYNPPEYFRAHIGLKAATYSNYVNLCLGLRGPPIA